MEILTIRDMIGQTGVALRNTQPYQHGILEFEGKHWEYLCGSKVKKGDVLLVKTVDTKLLILFVIKKEN